MRKPKVWGILVHGRDKVLVCATSERAAVELLANCGLYVSLNNFRDYSKPAPYSGESAGTWADKESDSGYILFWHRVPIGPSPAVFGEQLSRLCKWREERDA